MTDLPPPPPMTSNQIVSTIRDHWVENIGANWNEAEVRAERGFWHLLSTGGIREWGFDKDGNTLYEPHIPKVSETIVYVLMNKEDN